MFLLTGYKKAAKLLTLLLTLRPGDGLCSWDRVWLHTSTPLLGPPLPGSPFPLPGSP